MIDDNEMGALVAPPAAAAAPAPATIAPARRAVFAGYNAQQLLLGAALLVALVWAMWITKAVTAEKPQHIVKADLSKIVGEYVQAQARSATPPEQVQSQMRTFMASLDGELQRRGAAGQVVLVGEAVLSKSVPDITAEVAKAVYASGVKVPQAASPNQMGAMLRGQAPIAPVAPAAAPSPVELAQAPTAVSPDSPFGPMPTADAGVAGPAPDMAAQGASVSTFGGPGGQ